MDHETQQRMQYLSRKIREDYGPLTLALPLPRRRQLPLVKEYAETYLTGNNTMLAMDLLIEAGLSSQKIYGDLSTHSDHIEFLKATGQNQVSVSAYIQQRRFELLQGRLFTLRGSLIQRLNDFDIGEKLPVSFLHSPYQTVYLEFGEAENRAKSELKDAQGCYIEGVYISECEDIDVSEMSEQAREGLKLKSGQPARIFEMGFTQSPLNHPNPAYQMAMFDITHYIALVVQNEEETVEELIDRHLDYYVKNAQVGPALKDDLDHLMPLVVKALLYINADQNELKDDKEFSDLAKRLEKVADKKRAKLERQADRAYDRILVGPDGPYTPLSDIQNKFAGKIKPHFRRGHFAIRWVGSGEDKEGRLTWIKPALVNKEAFEEAGLELPNYDVF